MSWLQYHSLFLNIHNKKVDCKITFVRLFWKWVNLIIDFLINKYDSWNAQPIDELKNLTWRFSVHKKGKYR